MNQDPIGLGGGLNLYKYANNSPLRFSDPLGLCGLDVQSANDSIIDVGMSRGDAAAIAATFAALAYKAGSELLNYLFGAGNQNPNPNPSPSSTPDQSSDSLGFEGNLDLGDNVDYG